MKYQTLEELERIIRELTELSKQERKIEKLSNREINKIQKISSKLEFEFEKEWAKKIISSKKPARELKNYPDLKSYEKQTNLESKSLSLCNLRHAHKKMLFIGGGPMPLTAILLSKKLKIKTIIIDSNKEAVRISRKLIEKLGIKNIKVKYGIGENFKGYEKYEIIFVASLAGRNDKEKIKIFKRIKEQAKPDAHIIARSSYGGRKILYRPLHPKIYKIFEPILEVRAPKEMLNSIQILKN